jgi:hypothetical protein
MSDYPKTYVTKPLESDRVIEALLSLPSFLQGELESNTILTAVYGWNSGLHPDLCYRDMHVGINWVNKFIADSLRQEIVIPSQSDFTLTVPDNRMTLHFCHEGDIHTGGDDFALQKRLWATKPFSDFSFYWFEGKYLLSKEMPTEADSSTRPARQRNNPSSILPSAAGATSS